MPILQIENLSWPAVEALDRECTLLLQPVSPIEEHGPHLPLGVDIWGAEYFAREIVNRYAVERPHWNVAVLPSLVLGSNAFTAPGSVSVRQTAMRDVIYDIGASWARHGFRYLFLASGHGAAGHLVALEEGAHDERLGRELTETERVMLKGDTHGGLLETSFMLKLRPDLVSGEYTNLAPYDPSMFTRLQTDYATRDGGAGYVGYPAAATAAFGEAALAAFVEIAYERMIEAMADPEPEELSLLTRMPFLRPGWKRTARTTAMMGGVALVAFLLGRRFGRAQEDADDTIDQ